MEDDKEGKGDSNDWSGMFANCKSLEGLTGTSGSGTSVGVIRDLRSGPLPAPAPSRGQTHLTSLHAAPVPATQTQVIESQQLLNLQVNRLSREIEIVNKLKKRMLRPVQKVE
jgi:hypothetical protein